MLGNEREATRPIQRGKGNVNANRGREGSEDVVFFNLRARDSALGLKEVLGYPSI